MSKSGFSSHAELAECGPVSLTHPSAARFTQIRVYFNDNRLLPRSEEDDVLDEDMQRQMTGITEEDLDYVDNDDEEVLTYFTRTGLDSTMTNPMSSEGYSYEDMY
mmetsp:Transcript_10127/g.42525  ORF Transcript_10127/g.42525 Transcript_10127/m.42525 type:complete len:105 (-) Transcript_10127:107-421(-)